MIIDRLYEEVYKKGHVCVGLDTDLDYLPKEFLNKHTSIDDALFSFNKEIIDATGDVASCFKVQIAYYESYGLSGLKAYKNTLKYLKEKGLVSIADIKRGDIAKTAEMYAKAHFEGDFEADFITLAPYMGMDGIEPYMPYIKNKEKGAFILLRTSNKGAEDIQYIETSKGTRVYNEVGNKIKCVGKEALGNCGYSSIGAVVGCTHVDEGIKIRKEMDSTFFLIPGYGAQGGKAEDVALYLKDGNGGVVNSSRGILLAYKKNGEEKNFAIASRNEAVRMKEDLLNAVAKCK